MFKIVEKTSIEWPVNVEVPQDGGRTTKHSFSAVFRVLPQEEITSLAENNEDPVFLSEVLIGWSGVADESGTPIEYSDEMKAKLLSIPYVRRAVLVAFFEASNGKAAARKN